MSVLFNEVRKGVYLDSVALMRLSAELTDLAGIEEAVLMIGTPANLQIMRNADILDGSGEEAGPNDLVIAIRADRKASINRALAHAEKSMQGNSASARATEHRARTLRGSHSANPESNLCLISTPGEYASIEAHTALDLGMNVMIFSDNVPLERELELKQKARDLDLLVMGPDCGTAYINGVPLAFANAVNKGTTGVIAASGTGLQEFSVLLHRAGGGIKHGIGVGGRDLSDSIGGISTLTAIDLLANDKDVEQIVLISKPPGDATAKKVFAKLGSCGKPVIACVFGFSANQIPDGIGGAQTLKHAAELALSQMQTDAQSDGITVRDTLNARQDLSNLAADLAANADAKRQSLVGLYTGGTLCTEALLILTNAGLSCSSNTVKEGLDQTAQHQLIDLGADEYTIGRPHPMIEPAVRTPLLLEALNNNKNAVILLDVVLGYGAHENPAADVVSAINAADVQKPLIIASVCGTDLDPQNYQQQCSQLDGAGVIVCDSNTEAAELGSLVIQQLTQN